MDLPNLTEDISATAKATSAKGNTLNFFCSGLRPSLISSFYPSPISLGAKTNALPSPAQSEPPQGKSTAIVGAVNIVPKVAELTKPSYLPMPIAEDVPLSKEALSHFLRHLSNPDLSLSEFLETFFSPRTTQV